MLPPLTPLLKRLVVGLTSSLLVAGALGIGFRLNSTGYFALRTSQVGITTTTQMPLPVHSQNKADDWPPNVKHVSPNHLPSVEQDENELTARPCFPNAFNSARFAIGHEGDRFAGRRSDVRGFGSF